MKYAIELEFETADIVKGKGWRLVEAVDIPSKEKREPDQCYIFVGVNNHTRGYALNPFENPEQEDQDKTRYTCYNISSDEYNRLRKNKKLRPILSNDEKDVLFGVYSEAWWQVLCGSANPLINVDATKGLADILAAPTNAWNIGTQLGYPVGLGIIAAVMRGIYAYENFKTTYHREPDSEELRIIIEDCAAFAAKIAISMGAWELGYLAGQAVITLLHLSPFTLWVPIALCLSVGLVQGIFAVVNQVWDEKRKYGEVRSSTLDLVKIFLTTFIGGALWQALSYIPFVPLLTAHIIKPLADILGNLLLGLVTFIALLIVNHVVPLAIEKIAAATTFFFADKNLPEKEPFFQKTDSLQTQTDQTLADQSTITTTQTEVDPSTTETGDLPAGSPPLSPGFPPKS